MAGTAYRTRSPPAPERAPIHDNTAGSPRTVATSRLLCADFCRPGALDVGEHGGDVPVAQYGLESGHIALVSGKDAAGSFLRDLDELLVGVVPGVARSVVWRGGHPPVRLAGAPVRLPFPVPPGATRQITRINRPPAENGRAAG